MHVKAHLYNGGTGFGDSFHVAHDVWMYLSSEVTWFKIWFRADCACMSSTEPVPGKEEGR